MTVTGLELDAADEWVYSVLSGDSTLLAMLGDNGSGGVAPGIFTDTIRDDTKYPYVISNLMASADMLTEYQDAILVVADLTIKAVDRAETYAGLKAINQRLYQLLHQQSGTVSSGMVLKCARQRQIKYPSINETIQYRHLGGIFRFWLEGS